MYHEKAQKKDVELERRKKAMDRGYSCEQRKKEEA